MNSQPGGGAALTVGHRTVRVSGSGLTTLLDEKRGPGVGRAILPAWQRFDLRQLRSRNDALVGGASDWQQTEGRMRAERLPERLGVVLPVDLDSVGLHDRLLVLRLSMAAAR